MRLDRNECVLAIIDVQERLMPVIHDDIVPNLLRLIRGAEILGMPVVVTEQYVKGLGRTVEIVREALGERYAPVEKLSFSAAEHITQKQVLIAGVETHVCVYQTALDLLAAGREVWVAADAVSSRTARNRDIGLQRMMSDGARLSSTEMALFELLGVAGTDAFRAISTLVK
ncbi:MAG TPA: isochorismatase family protein [Thermoanaerobaculia bacterium]|nr:isochorismatase family protein [Thermoanaerobaculia bacterium]